MSTYRYHIVIKFIFVSALISQCDNSNLADNNNDQILDLKSANVVKNFEKLEFKYDMSIFINESASSDSTENLKIISVDNIWITWISQKNP